MSEPTGPAELHAIAHSQLGDAYRLYRFGRYLPGAALAVGVLVMFFPKIAYLGAVAALIIQGAIWYTRQTAQQKQAVGDEIRRRALLSDALGQFDQAFDLAELLGKVSDEVREHAKARIKSDYFASKAPVGIIRLCDHLRENSFWNRSLYSEASRLGKRILWITATASIVVFLLAFYLAPQDATVNVMRVFVVVVTFLLAYTFLIDVIAWQSAANAIERLDRQLDSFKNLDETSLLNRNGQIMAILSEYTVATSKVAPVPSKVYKENQVRLNKIWKERDSATNSP
ncbi:hypothetical protein [Lentzea sp. NPDC059081]|uniref:hypothetical protein n=1 Tax=Lentzea sp. NPDC059081 TaxID=3346719 RepID=UPI00368B322D